MSALADPVEALADAFFAALEAGSADGVLACYAPDARIWHNFDRLALAPQESMAGVKTLFATFPRRRYVEVRRQSTPSGFVQQHVLRLERADGKVIDWPGCIVCDVQDGRIARLDEYVDLGQLSAGG